MAAKRIKRKIATILFADGVGYSRLMAEDAVATVRTLKNIPRPVRVYVVLPESRPRQQNS